jgi:hypothetical protein
MEMTKQRMMKLAGILNESANGLPINEVSTSDLNSTIKYFTDFKKQMTITCDQTLAALKKTNPDPKEVASIFTPPARKLTSIDPLIKDWVQYCLKGSNRRPGSAPIFSEKNFSPKRIKSVIKYFEDIKKYSVSSSDKAILGLQKVKSLGKRATDDDIELVQDAWSKDAFKMQSMDSSFERWWDWCVNEIFYSLYSENQ